ncbi:FadR family transcriptional regulator [Cytobacillus firmus]|nr:FadR family transcriptional regulator [Cytobacillus firmus]
MLEGKINQLKKTTLAQDIVQQLMELIINGSIAPGEKLPSERQLMEMFGVGRSSLREAIRALVALELVEVRVPEGTFVTQSFGGFFTKHLSLMSKISFENISELVEARLKLETMLVELAAKKSGQKEGELLDKIILSMKDADNEGFLHADLKFHMTIAKIAGNSFLFEVMHILQDITKAWMFKVIESYPIQEEAIKHHEKIAQAIKNNDIKSAGEAMTEHIEIVSKLLLEFQDEEK